VSGVVGRGKWPGLIELFGAVWTADPSRHTRRPAVMPPAARIAPHMCSKSEPFSATKVRQTIRSFTALTLTQVSEELNVSRGHVYGLVRRGELTGVQVGCRRAWRVERAMLEEFITDAYRRVPRRSSTGRPTR